MKPGSFHSAVWGLAAGSGCVASLFFQPQISTAQIAPATLPDLKLSTRGTVNAVGFQEDGKIVVGGSFISINSVPRTNLARLNPNGSVDLTWNPPVPNGPVDAIAVTGSNIFIAGTFVNIGGVGANFLAKISALSSGNVDERWLPNPNNRVFALQLDGTHLYVGGDFTSIGGTNLSYLARVSVSESGTADSSWNPALNNRVFGLLADSSHVYVHGSFTTYAGLARNNLAKISKDPLQPPSAWDAQLAPLSTNGLSLMRSMALDGTNLFLAGSFTNVGGLSRRFLAKVNTGSGAIDQLWDPNGMQPFGNFAAITATNGYVYVGGTFSTIGLSVAVKNAARIHAGGQGIVDAAWRASLSSGSFNPTSSGVLGLHLSPNGEAIFARGNFTLADGEVSLGFAKLDLITARRYSPFFAQIELPGTVNALARQADGRFILGGDFWFAGGLPRQNLARVNLSGTLDTTWSPDVDGAVHALGIANSNLFAGGEFSRVSGLSRNGLVKIGITSNDTVDSAWNPGVSNAATAIYNLQIKDTNIFVAGSFFNFGGQPRKGLAKLSATGSGPVDAQWRADLDTSASSPGLGSLFLTGNDLFVCGFFTNVGGLARNSLAKVSAIGNGAVDVNWNPDVTAPPNEKFVNALVVEGTNLFVGGQFTNVGGQFRTNLAKVSTLETGAVDLLWNPPVNARVQSLAVSGTNLFVGMSQGHISQKGLIQIATTGIGLAATNFNPLSQGPGAISQVRTLWTSGDDVYVGGNFTRIGGSARSGFAFLPVADAPILLQDSTTTLFIARNAADGPEVTHFRIASIDGGTLYLGDGVTTVGTNDFLTVAQGEAGLQFVSGGTITVVSALNNTTNGTGTAFSTLTMSAQPSPVFKLSATTYSVREGKDNIVITVRKFGNGAASVNYATTDLTATGTLDYQTRIGTLNFSATDKLKNIIIALANDLQVEGDEQFAITLTNASAGASIADPAKSVVTIVDNDLVGASDSLTTTLAPTMPPLSTGVLTVSLQPTSANGQWRLVGEINWHDSGAMVSGLVNDNYGIEFRPVDGYFPPSATPFTVPISVGLTNQFLFSYVATTNLDTGNLSVVIQPDDIANAVNTNSRGQWLVVGESIWRDSGQILPNLRVGTYRIAFKPVPGRVTPPPQLVHIGSGNAVYSALGTYLFGSSPGAQTPSVVPFGTATTNEPFHYNGQIQTDVGFGSGFIVKQRVVLTAAHVLFDDAQLSYATAVRWFFQRYRDQLEPVPQIPRGWYVFDGYAAQRELDNSPRTSTPSSQNLDAAAMYFLDDAGRGGFGGYLSTDADNNEFLLGANNKFLAGYPLDGIDDADDGKLHATMPINLTFTHLYNGVFSTTNLQSYPGNSGGPLYVQSDVNQYLPAAIYLGGSGQTLVRAINSEIVDLINRAEVSGNGGGNSTGGGVTISSPGVTASPFGTGLLTVNMTPSNATNIRPGWRVTGNTDTNFLTDATKTIALVGSGSYPIQFSPVPGFITPSNRTVSVAIGGLVTIQADYIGIRPQLSLNRTNGLILSGGVGALYRVEFKTNLATQTTWTSLTSRTLSTSPLLLSNSLPATNGDRFYRAVLVP